MKRKQGEPLLPTIFFLSVLLNLQNPRKSISILTFSTTITNCVFVASSTKTQRKKLKITKNNLEKRLQCKGKGKCYDSLFTKSEFPARKVNNDDDALPKRKMPQRRRNTIIIIITITTTQLVLMNQRCQ